MAFPSLLPQCTILQDVSKYARQSTIIHSCYVLVGVRGSPAGDIVSLRAFAPGGRLILRVVRASARALFDVFEETLHFVFTKR